MKSLSLVSPAKLNLVLKVLNKRADGFHNLKTLFERIDLVDDITLVPLAENRIRIECDNPQVPRGPSNLVYKVAVLLKTDFGISSGVKIIIRKRIPVAAGLAGGSSNAATVLRGLNKLWNLGLGQKQLVAYARKIGSDVAFFLYDSSWGVGTERGDRIRVLKIRPKVWHVLVVPRVKMLTKKVFGVLNLKLTNKNDDVNILIHYLRKNDLNKVGKLLSNDLENAIIDLKRGLLKAKKELEKLQPLGVSFSGSGPSVFAIVASKTQAENFKKALSKRYTRVYMVKTY